MKLYPSNLFTNIPEIDTQILLALPDESSESTIMQNIINFIKLYIHVIY